MNQTPESQCSILYIDDEEKALKYFRMAFSPKFSILTASSGEEGLALLRKESGKIGVVVSDQRMPGMIGAEVLGIVREEFPHVVRILTTAYSDLQSAILAVNKGHIYQYVVKPWEVTELEMVLRRAVDYYHILSERNQLLRLKMSTLQRVICCDRVKWLLLTLGNGDEKAAVAFRKALFVLIRALCDIPAPHKAGDVFRTDQFDAASLIQREIHAGGRIRALLNGPDAKDSLSPECLAVTRLGKESDIPAASLGAFLSLLPEEVSASVEVSEGVKVAYAPVPSGFVEDLTGILFANEPKPSSVLLLKTLWKFAEAGISLNMEVARQATAPFLIPTAPATVSEDDVVEALREVFERWDVASL